MFPSFFPYRLQIQYLFAIFSIFCIFRNSDSHTVLCVTGCYVTHSHNWRETFQLPFTFQPLLLKCILTTIPKGVFPTCVSLSKKKQLI